MQIWRKYCVLQRVKLFVALCEFLRGCHSKDIYILTVTAPLQKGMANNALSIVDSKGRGLISGNIQVV